MTARRRAPSWMVLLSGVVAIAIAAGLGGARAYVARDAAACTARCHTSDPKAHVTAAGHKALACQRCHDVDGGVKLLFSSLVGVRRGVRAHGKVTAKSCTACHNELDARWSKIAETSGHRVHRHVAKVDCLSCHRDSAHSGQVQGKACVACHENATLHAAKDFDEKGQPECLSCHNFAASAHGKPWLTLDKCTRCHSAGNNVGATVIRAEDLHGGVDCKLCHQPHHDFGRGLATPPCTQCHDIKIGTENKELPKEHHDCNSCHKVHAPLKRAGAQCKNCHEQARLREGGTRTTALEHDECQSCHVPHSWVPDKNGCVRCHNREATLVFTKSPVEHQQCVNCHDIHGPPPVGTICGKCHKDNAAKMRAGPARHQICTSCHNPHAPRPQPPQACIACHANEVRELVAVGPAGHARANCTSCHTIHGNPRIDASKCAMCHKDKSTLVAKAEPVPHRNCLSCHKQHRFSVAGVRLPCLNCHEKIATTAEIHTGKCTKCHNQHGSPLVPQERCLGCHQQIHLAPINAKHSRCDSCHVPHKKKEAALGRCRQCHADKAQIADLWPVNSAHHQACNNCHNQHNVREKKACGSCHQQEQSMVVVNPKHQCIGCHAPHQAPPSARAGWWDRCVNCHKSEATESKQHTACNNCHKPHYFQPPKCVQCHAANIQKGLHTVKAHAECGKCHETHPASLPTRKNCLACHKDRVDHQPDAQRCQACHLFK